MDFTGLQDWLVDAASAPWLPFALFALVVLDAFLVVVPSETAVVALGSLALSTGSPNVVVVLIAAAAGAVVGDSACYLIGRAVTVRPPSRPRLLASAFRRAERLLARRAAVLILTARYVPFARIAVNLTAGATRFHYRRFLPLSVIAGIGWAVFNVLVGAGVGAWLGTDPLVAVVVSVVVAIGLGIAVDWAAGRIASRREVTGGDAASGRPSAR
ncbi:DedA family protein [Herbiconiux sp. L3-i23]|uniref:DedA family protein n=1 Tax=Herbiconiux sp. L3-i23 TaxID=2905871 RepID=UPI00204FBB1F|nr:VTT domain-containing protein [Herbiconiux sp. L3-i23]BDI22172.1 membrane protein [Herbiconiux sp. L3-i23]